MRTWTRILLGCLTLTVAGACGDSPTSPAPPAAAPAADLVPVTSPLDAQIRSTIDALFPRLVGDVINGAWNVIVGELVLSRKPGLTDRQRALLVDLARKQLVALVAFIQSRTGRIIPPAGETQDHAAARLILLMSLYVYNGPESIAPDVPPGSDAVVAIVQPSATTTQTVRTPTQHAAVQFPPGSLGETRIIAITQLPTPYPVNCSGPLQTRLCQYPQFYEINSFPDTRLQSPAIAAVCHINAGDSRLPLENHDGFRIAHDAPADPANYVDGGTIVDGVEVLPFVLVSGLTSCEGNSYFSGQSPIPVAPSGALGSALRRLGGPAMRLASAVFGRLAPRQAWAIDGIGGGRLSVFSTFGIVDPAGRPDLSVTIDPPGHEGSYSPGDVVQIGSWSVANIGTAKARVVISHFVVYNSDGGTVSSTIAGDEEQGLAPGQSVGGSGASVTLPLGLANGTYYVGAGAVINDVDGLTESNYENNQQTFPIEVFTPVIGRLESPSESRFSVAASGRDRAQRVTASVSEPSRAGRRAR